MRLKEITTLIKYVVKPVRLVDAYYFLKERKKGRETSSVIGMKSSTQGSVLGEYCVIRDNNVVLSSKIGRRTRIKCNCKIYNANIGKFCAFAENVQLGAGVHPVYFASTNFIFYSKNKSIKTFSDGEYFLEEHNRIEVGHDVWFGANSSVVGNVKIGSGAIVAYGAVVTKDVPPYTIVGGVPARVIKKRFSDEVINRLLEIQWWDLSDDFFVKHFKLMHDPEKLIEFYDRNKDYVESFRLQG